MYISNPWTTFCINPYTDMSTPSSACCKILKLKIVKSIMLGKLAEEQGERQDYIIEHFNWNVPIGNFVNSEKGTKRR